MSDWDNWQPTDAAAAGDAAFRARVALARGGPAPTSSSNNAPPARASRFSAPNGAGAPPSSTGRAPLPDPPSFPGKGRGGPPQRALQGGASSVDRGWGAKAPPPPPASSPPPAPPASRSSRNDLEDRMRARLEAEKSALKENGSSRGKERERSRDRERNRDRGSRSDRRSDSGRDRDRDRDSDRRSERSKDHRSERSDRKRERSRSRERDRDSKRDRRDDDDRDVRRQRDSSRDRHSDRHRSRRSEREGSTRASESGRKSESGRERDRQPSSRREDERDREQRDRRRKEDDEERTPKSRKSPETIPEEAVEVPEAPKNKDDMADEPPYKHRDYTAVELKDKPRLQVANIVSGTSVDDIVSTFIEFGTILQCRRLPSRKESANNGLVFEVTFQTEDEAEAAKLRMDGCEADGAIIEITYIPPLSKLQADDEEDRIAEVKKEEKEAAVEDFPIKGAASSAVGSLLARLGGPVQNRNPISERLATSTPKINGHPEPSPSTSILPPYEDLLAKAGVRDVETLRKLVRSSTIPEYVEMLSDQFPEEELLKGMTAKWALRERLEEWLGVKEEGKLDWGTRP